MQSPLVLPAMLIPENMYPKIGIIVAGQGSPTVGILFGRVYEELQQRSLAPEHVKVVSIPGSYDLMQATQNMLARDAYDVIICLACSPLQSRKGIPHLSETTRDNLCVVLHHRVPVFFGVVASEKQQPTDILLEYGTRCVEAALEMVRRKRGY